MDAERHFIRDQFDAMFTSEGEMSSALPENCLDCSGDVEHAARQEFKDDADLNVLLRRFGAIPTGSAPVFGEYDFDLTLQDAIAAGRESSRAWSRLPADVQARYGSWPAVLAALDRGELKLKLPTAEAASGGSEAAGGGSGPPAGDRSS